MSSYTLSSLQHLLDFSRHKLAYAFALVIDTTNVDSLNLKKHLVQDAFDAYSYASLAIQDLLNGSPATRKEYLSLKQERFQYLEEVLEVRRKLAKLLDIALESVSPQSAC